MKKRLCRIYTILFVFALSYMMVSCESENEYSRIEGTWKISSISLMGLNQNMDQFVSMMEGFGVDATCMASTNMVFQADGNGLLVFPCNASSPQTIFTYTVNDKKIAAEMHVDGNSSILSGVVSDDYNSITFDDFGFLINSFIETLPEEFASMVSGSVSVSLSR